MRAQPPRAPRRLERLPEHAELEVDGVRRGDARRRPAAALRGQALPDPQGRRRRGPAHAQRRERLPARDRQPGLPRRADRGHRRHRDRAPVRLARRRIVPSATTFSNTISAYDTLTRARGSTPRTSSPSRHASTSSTSRFEERARGAQFGAPRDFAAHTTTTDGPGAPRAPADAEGQRAARRSAARRCSCSATATRRSSPCGTPRATSLYSGATPFLPQDNNYTSVGAIKVRCGPAEAVGFAGFFLPTAEPTSRTARARCSPT